MTTKQSQKLTTIELTSDEAKLFVEFQRNFEFIAYIIGYLDSMGESKITGSNVVLDIDMSGRISHVAITKHYRRDSAIPLSNRILYNND